MTRDVGTFLSFSWVATKDSAAPEGGSEISIEKLETQLNTLKTMFAEKQKLVSDLEAYGPEGKTQLNTLKTICLPKRKKFSDAFRLLKVNPLYASAP